MILGLGVGRSHDEARVYPFWECDRGVGVGVFGESVAEYAG